MSVSIGDGKFYFRILWILSRLRVIFHLFTDISEFICSFCHSNGAPATKIGKLYHLFVVFFLFVVLFCSSCVIGLLCVCVFCAFSLALFYFSSVECAPNGVPTCRSYSSIVLLLFSGNIFEQTTKHKRFSSFSIFRSLFGTGFDRQKLRFEMLNREKRRRRQRHRQQQR